MMMVDSWQPWKQDVALLGGLLQQVQPALQEPPHMAVQRCTMEPQLLARQLCQKESQEALLRAQQQALLH